MGSLASLVDELGEIEAELLPFKPKFKRAEALRAALRGAHKDAPASATFALRGARYVALLGVCGNETVIDNGLLLARIGAPAFAALASVTLKAVTAQCAPEVAAEVVSTQMSGSRSLALQPIPASIAEQKPAVKRAKKS